MIRTFLFDMGNVLTYFSHEKMYRQTGALYNLTEEQLRQISIQSGIHEKYERGELSSTEFQQTLESHVNGHVPLEKLLLATSDIFSLNHEILPLLDQLRSANYRLVLLSNTCVAHINFIQEQWQLLKWFDDVVLSYEVGALKPDPEIYEAALQKIDCLPQEAFFIDDLPENIVQARFHGLQGIQFTGTHDLVNSLQEEQGISLEWTF